MRAERVPFFIFLDSIVNILFITVGVQLVMVPLPLVSGSLVFETKKIQYSFFFFYFVARER